MSIFFHFHAFERIEKWCDVCSQCFVFFLLCLGKQICSYDIQETIRSRDVIVAIKDSFVGLFLVSDGGSAFSSGVGELSSRWDGKSGKTVCSGMSTTK